MSAGRPPLYNTPEEMSAAIEEYFMPEVEDITTVKSATGKIVTKTGNKSRQPREKVTISGLAYHLGFESRQSFYDYEEKPEFTYIIKRARIRVEISYEERLAENACTGAIFALKNMGWRDKTEQESYGKDGGPIVTENKLVVELHDFT